MSQTYSLRIENANVISWNHKSPNLYIEIDQDGSHILTTSVVKRDLAPRWNEDLNLTAVSTSSQITVLLYHVTSFPLKLKSHTCLGKCITTIGELLQLCSSPDAIKLDIKANGRATARVFLHLQSASRNLDMQPGDPQRSGEQQSPPQGSPLPIISSDSSMRSVVDVNSEDIAVPQTASPWMETVAAGYDQAMTTESTVDEILKACERFRIVSVGRAGAGKSSLINCVFKVNDAKVSHFAPGEAHIYSEITSETNPRFVLHDSKGFEPADMDTFKVVRDFIIAKSDTQLKLKDRLHAVWLCIQTPTHGARLLEAGDEEFLQLANKRQIPVVVVFTQYDRLVRKDQVLNKEDSENAAQRDFDGYVESLKDTAKRLKIKMPSLINVSIRKGYNDNILKLVDLTRKIVEERLKGDAWILWAVAQKASIPLKIDACVSKGMSYYWRALSGSIPVAGKPLLRECLLKVHQDIIACWNMRNADSMLNGDEFKHLMLYVVQDMQREGHTNSSPVDTGKISDFVKLCTAASAAIAPPVAILGLTYIFVSWISNAVLEHTYVSTITARITFPPNFGSPEVERVLIAYTVDLILVLEELFKIVLQPKAAGSASWSDLREAVEAYHRTTSQSTVHGAVSDLVENRGQLMTDLNFLRKSVEELVHKYRVM
ncbi:hypothetical protein C8R44DRAFT_251809 [Mycena epipterygia]|nr:hypothetical protein C8R44DRAFT_251809 [Mycena epipterygia]